MFIGLAMHFVMLTFRQIQNIYTFAGGPSFVVEQFDPGKSDEVERIAAFFQDQSLELVCQTVLQTAIQAVGPGATFIDTKPADPPIGVTPEIELPDEVMQIAGDFAN
jgi:hypothetical protein